MSKPFFEVFPSLQLNTDIRDLMGQTEVERVSATKRRKASSYWTEKDMLSSMAKKSLCCPVPPLWYRLTRIM